MGRWLVASRRRKVGLVLVVVLLTAFGGSRWLLRSTPVTVQEAVEEFRRERASVAATASPTPGTRAGVSDPRTAPSAGPVTLVSEGTVPDGATVRPLAFRPAEGTYVYDATGEEGVPGYRRDLSGETYRNVVHEGPRAWQDHHLFRKQRQSWTTYGQDDRGRYVTSTRNLIAFGDPEIVTLDETVVFEPALRGALLPWRVGKRWHGTFEGETYGTYEAGTIEHGWMRVGNERVEFWVDEIDIRLQGDITGRVLVRRWISPMYGLVLREEYDAEADKGPITYSARWSVTLRSMTPRL